MSHAEKSWDNVTSNPLSSQPDEISLGGGGPSELRQSINLDYSKMNQLRESFQFGGNPSVEDALDIRGIDTELYTRISAQLRDFYDFFKSLYDSDQNEINGLSAQLNLNKQEVKRLRTAKQQLEQKLTEAEAAVVEAKEATQSATEAASSAFAHSAAQEVPFSPAAPPAPPAQSGVVAGGGKGAGAGGGAGAGAGAGAGGGGSLDFARASTWNHSRAERDAASLPPNPPPPSHPRVSDDTSPSVDNLDRLALKDPSKQLMASILKKVALSSGGGAGGGGVDKGKGKGKGEGKTTHIVFLPPHLLTTNPWYKWPSYFYQSYKKNPIVWLAFFWLFIALLATGLLIGLLVPWSDLSGSASSPSTNITYLSQGTLRSFPPGPNYLSFVSSSPRSQDTIYYLVVPQSTLQGLNLNPPIPPGEMTHRQFNLTSGPQTLTAPSIVSLVDKGVGTAALINASVACGKRQMQGVNIGQLLSVESFSIYNLECVSLRLAAVKSPGNNVQGTGNCLTCPYLEPDVPYALITASSDGSTGTLGLLFATSNSTGDVPVLPSAWPPPPAPLSLPLFNPPSPPPTPQRKPPSPSLSPPPPDPASEAPVFISPLPSVVATSESSIELTFQVQGAGVVNYAIQAEKSFFWQGGWVSSYPSPPPSLPISIDPLKGLPGGVLAAGSINVKRRLSGSSSSSSGTFGCRIGMDDGLSPCSCGQAVDKNPCVLPAPCTGNLCSASLYALAPNTTYVVWINTQSEDGSGLSKTVALGAVTTFPPSLPASLFLSSASSQSSPASSSSSSGARINASSIGPSSFAIDSVGQDKIGFVYLLVTKPVNQSQAQLVPEGSASSLRLEPPGKISGRRRRALSAVSAAAPGNTSGPLQLDTQPTHFGFIPLVIDSPASSLSRLVPSQCAIQKPCDLSWLVSTFVSAKEETWAFQDCLAITDISQRGGFVATGLESNTLYSVKLISVDPYYNFNWYSSELRTVDASPPSFLNVTGLVFSSNLTLDIILDKPSSEVYGYLVQQSLVSSVTVERAWPPTLLGPISSAQGCKTSAEPDPDSPALAPTWSCLLTFADPGTVSPNTDYVALLIAADSKGNVQTNFTVSDLIHTDDVPVQPEWITYSIDASGPNATLTLELDKSSFVFYLLDLTSSFPGGVCPLASNVYSGSLGKGVTSSTLIASGPLLFDSAQGSSAYPLPPLTSSQQLIDSRSYLLCLAAYGVSPPSTRQASALALSFNTTDHTPPRFLQLTANSTNATSINIFATLDEPKSVVSCLLLASPSAAPSPRSIFDLSSGSNTSLAIKPASYGTFIAVLANVTAQSTAQGLRPGVTYDIYCIAKDKIGNPQPSVTAVKGVSTFSPLIVPTSVALVLAPPSPSGLYLTAPSDGATLAPFYIPTSLGPFTILVKLSDGTQANLSSSLSSLSNLPQALVNVSLVPGGETWCRAAPAQFPGSSPATTSLFTMIQAIPNGSESGSCQLSVTLSYPGLNLTLNGTSRVASFVTMGPLESTVQVDEVRTAGSGLGGGPTPLVLSLYKCDWTRYQPAAFSYSTSLANCTTSSSSSLCSRYLLDDYVNVTLDDPSLALTLRPTPQAKASSSSSLIVPLQAGVASLVSQFGATSLVTVLSVQDSFLPGWPRLAPISDTSLVIQANMTDGPDGWTIGYRMVVAGSYDQVPGPSEVLSDANFLEVTPYPDAVGGGFYSKQVTGLEPGTNYSVFLALSPYPPPSSGTPGLQGPFLPTTIVFTGLLTLNESPPSFQSVGPLLPSTNSTSAPSSLFSLEVDVSLDRAGTSLSYLVLPSLPCLNQSLVTTDLVLNPSSQQVSCGCDQALSCLPLSSGEVYLGLDRNTTLEIDAFQFLSPFEFLSPSTCSSLPPLVFAQQSYVLYLVAQTPAPKYKDYVVSCAPPSSIPSLNASSLALTPHCDAAAYAPCFASPPSSPPLPNIQSDPFISWSPGQQLQSSSQARPVAIPFSLFNQSFAFVVVNITATGSTLQFDFQVNQQAVVLYSLDLNILSKGSFVTNGTIPALSPYTTTSVTISSWCADVKLSPATYSFSFWAIDVFGIESPKTKRTVLLSG